MYAADLPQPDDDASHLVDEYLEFAEEILREVFGYTDTGRDLLEDVEELTFRYRAIPPVLRRYANLAGHYQFVRTVALGGAA